MHNKRSADVLLLAAPETVDMCRPVCLQLLTRRNAWRALLYDRHTNRKRQFCQIVQKKRENFANSTSLQGQ